MATTSMPCCSRRAFVCSLRSYATASRGPMARVLLPSSHCSRSAVTGSRPVSIWCSVSMPMASAAAAKNDCSAATTEVVARPGDREGAEVVGHVGVDDDGVDVDHRDDRVEVHRGALLRDRHGQHGVGELGAQHLAREPLEPGRRGALADTDGHDAGGQQQDVAALEVLEVRAVQRAATPAKRGWCS